MPRPPADAAGRVVSVLVLVQVQVLVRAQGGAAAAAAGLADRMVFGREDISYG
jgi:hypothetical protein